MQEALARIRAIAAAGDDRIERARQLAEVVRGLRNYRWTGVYDDPQHGEVIGTIDVESEQADAFSARDQQLLEECAKAALPLWTTSE